MEILTVFVLDQWVSKFEREYELCYKASVSPGQAPGDLEDEDVEALFEELHRRTEAEQLLEYASRKFDRCVPRHALLDTGVSRSKARLNHRKSFRERRDNDPAAKFNDETSPKMDCNARSTNTARESSCLQKQVSVEMKDKRNNSLVLREDAEVCANQSFLTTPIKPSQQNEYEDIRVFQKRKKKKKAPEENRSKEIENDKIQPVEAKISPTEVKEKTEVFEVENPTTLPVSETKKEPAKFVREEKTHRKEKRPFESFQNCLFSLYTACVPWSCVRRVYWKQDHRSEEIFTKTSRRNSRAKLKRTRL